VKKEGKCGFLLPCSMFIFPFLPFFKATPPKAANGNGMAAFGGLALGFGKCFYLGMFFVLSYSLANYSLARQLDIAIE